MFESLTDFKRLYKYLNTFSHTAHTFCRVLFGVHLLLINSFSTQISVTVLDLVEYMDMIGIFVYFLEFLFYFLSGECVLWLCGDW
jgi:hypothetical protein